MKTVFYRDRDGHAAEVCCTAGATVRLAENRRYLFRFLPILATVELDQLTDIGAEFLGADSALLSFGNYVGRFSIRGVQFDVVSRKLGEAGTQGLLAQTLQLASALVYGWHSPLQIRFERSGARRHHVPFHDLVYLRHEMLHRPVGERFRDKFDLVADQPTRKLSATHRRVPVHMVRAVDRGGLVSLALHSAHLAELSLDHALFGHPLGLALEARGGDPGRRFFPTTVMSTSRISSFDTPENRFLKHLLTMCQEIVRRFLDRPELGETMRRDVHVMSAQLESLERAPFLEGVGRATATCSPTQAMLKSDGYRELFDVYRSLLDEPTLPQDPDQARRMMDGNDVAQLYEYWAFLKVLEATCAALGVERPRVPVRVHEFGGLIPQGLTVHAANDVSVTFNAAYPGVTAEGSYSTALRPDVVVNVGAIRFVFDAKYRMDNLPPIEVEPDDDGPPGSRDKRDTPDRLWKRADLYKMHTYRDALGVPCAFVLYPGDLFTFFECTAVRRDSPAAIGEFAGVGAAPLRPEVEGHGQLLKQLLNRMIAEGRRDAHAAGVDPAIGAD
jgi:hypothetical protein